MTDFKPTTFQDASDHAKNVTLKFYQIRFSIDFTLENLSLLLHNITYQWNSFSIYSLDESNLSLDSQDRDTLIEIMYKIVMGKPVPDYMTPDHKEIFLLTLKHKLNLLKNAEHYRDFFSLSAVNKREMHVFENRASSTIDLDVIDGAVDFIEVHGEKNTVEKVTEFLSKNKEQLLKFLK